MRVYQATLIGAGFVIALGYQTGYGQPAKQSSGRQQIERGRYVVDIAGCNDCHTAGYAEAGGKAPDSERLTGDVRGFRGPWIRPIPRTSDFRSAR